MSLRTPEEWKKWNPGKDATYSIIDGKGNKTLKEALAVRRLTPDSGHPKNSHYRCYDGGRLHDVLMCLLKVSLGHKTLTIKCTKCWWSHGEVDMEKDLDKPLPKCSEPHRKDNGEFVSCGNHSFIIVNEHLDAIATGPDKLPRWDEGGGIDRRYYQKLTEKVCPTCRQFIPN